MTVLQLVQHIPEAGLNFQRVPPSPTSSQEPEQGDQELRQRARSRDRQHDNTVDNTMLNPVSQVIVAIRENTEQLADKMK